MAEKSTTSDDVTGTMEFEEEWFAWLESPELRASRGLPEINFVGLLGAKIAEPVEIRYSDEKVHDRGL